MFDLISKCNNCHIEEIKHDGLINIVRSTKIGIINKHMLIKKYNIKIINIISTSNWFNIE